MFRLGRKVTKKLKKIPKEDSKPSRQSLEPTPLNIGPEYNSELAQARAKAFKKNHVVEEKGLPSFAEFGTRDMEDDYSEDEGHEPTFKPGLKVPGLGDPRVRSGRLSDGSDWSPVGTPSPHLSPYHRNSGDLTPSRHLSPAMTRHSSPLAEMDNYYSQAPPSPMPFRSTATPAPHHWIAQPAPVPGIDWERRDSYNPFDAVSYGAPTPAPPALEDRSIYDRSPRPGQSQWAHLAPNHPYRPPSSLYDPARQPARPPPPREPEVPFYPSPVSDRYGYPANDSQTSFDQNWTGRGSSPHGVAPKSPYHPPSHNHPQRASWADPPPSRYLNETPQPHSHHFLRNTGWQNQSRGPSPMPPATPAMPAAHRGHGHQEVHHQRSHTVDVPSTYEHRPFMDHQSHAHTRFPTEPSYHEVPQAQSWDTTQQQRNRTKSLHAPTYCATPAPSVVNPGPPPTPRPHRYSDVGHFHTRKPPPDVVPMQLDYSSHQTGSGGYGNVDYIAERMGRTHLTNHEPPQQWLRQQQSPTEASVYRHTPAPPAVSPTPQPSQRDSRRYSASPSPMAHSSTASSWETSDERVSFPQSASRTSMHSLAEDLVQPQYESELQAVTRRLLESRQSRYAHDVKQDHSPVGLARQKTRLPDPISPAKPLPESDPDRRPKSRQGRKSMSYSQPLAGGGNDEERSPQPDSPGATHPRSSIYDSASEAALPATPARSAPNTPHRRRTIVSNGPRGPRLPAGRVSLGIA